MLIHVVVSLQFDFENGTFFRTFDSQVSTFWRMLPVLDYWHDYTTFQNTKSARAEHIFAPSKNIKTYQLIRQELIKPSPAIFYS